jgi:hypothetical protein
MERIIINFKNNDVELFSIAIFANDSNPNDGLTTVVFKINGTFNVITEAEIENVSILNTKFEKVIKCASEIYSAKINTNDEDYIKALNNNLQYKLVDAVAEYAGHHYISVTGIKIDKLFELGSSDYCKYTVYKDPAARNRKLYDMMLVKNDGGKPSKTFITVHSDGDIHIKSNGMGVDLPLMGTDQFIGDKEFLDMSPEDKVEYIKKFSMLLSKRYDIVLVD